jgi:hypothetical protein
MYCKCNLTLFLHTSLSPSFFFNCLAEVLMDDKLLVTYELGESKGKSALWYSHDTVELFSNFLPSSFVSPSCKKDA